MSGINECSDLVDLRSDELSRKIDIAYKALDDRMIELDTKNKDHTRENVTKCPECPESNTGKLRMMFVVNIITCIMILIILFKSFKS